MKQEGGVHLLAAKERKEEVGCCRHGRGWGLLRLEVE